MSRNERGASASGLIEFLSFVGFVCSVRNRSHPNYGGGVKLRPCTMGMNPADLGPAPQISNASANPPYVVTNGASVSLFSCSVSPTNNLVDGFEFLRFHQ